MDLFIIFVTHICRFKAFNLQHNSYGLTVRPATMNLKPDLKLLAIAVILSCAAEVGGLALPIPSVKSTSRSLRRFSPTSLTAVASPTSIAICQVSGGAQLALNMSRESYKLQSMATYSTITALIMNASLRLYTSQKFAKTQDNRTRWCENLFQACTTLCIISGAFTAVLFNILGIYSKECLGLQNDAGYLAFSTATAIFRKWGFRCFLTTCMGFVGSFLLSVYERSLGEKELGKWVLVGSIILTLMAGYHIQTVLHLATKLIYTPEFCQKNHIA